MSNIICPIKNYNNSNKQTVTLYFMHLMQASKISIIKSNLSTVLFLVPLLLLLKKMAF